MWVKKNQELQMLLSANLYCQVDLQNLVNVIFQSSTVNLDFEYLLHKRNVYMHLEEIFAYIQ